MFVKDKDGNILKVDKNDSRIKTGELISNWKGLVTTRDKNGNVYRVSKDDPRIKSGELKHINNGRIIAYNSKNEKIYIEQNDNRLKTGELKLKFIFYKKGKPFYYFLDDEIVKNENLKPANCKLNRKYAEILNIKLK